MTVSPLPLEPLSDSRSKWLGGEAHVRALGGASLRMRLRQLLGRGPYSGLALAAAFTAGGLLGAGLIGLAYQLTRRHAGHSMTRRR